MIKKYLKQYLKQIYTKIGIVAMIIFTIIYCNNDYMEFKDRECIVLDKMTTDGYKTSGKFYLVLQDEQGVIFDLIVSPSTFSQSNIGDTKIFNLRNFDIKQTTKENLIYFFAPIIFISIGIVLLIAGWVVIYLNN